MYILHMAYGVDRGRRRMDGALGGEDELFRWESVPLFLGLDIAHVDVRYRDTIAHAATKPRSFNGD